MGDGTIRWYLVAHGRYGDVSVRVLPGMWLGETSEGELSFEQSCAQVEVDIADSGEVVLNAAEDRAFQSLRGIRCPPERVVLDRPAEIRLPHNIVQLSTESLCPQRALATIEVCAADWIDGIPEPEQLPETPRRSILGVAVALTLSIALVLGFAATRENRVPQATPTVAAVAPGVAPAAPVVAGATPRITGTAPEVAPAAPVVAGATPRITGTAPEVAPKVVLLSVPSPEPRRSAEERPPGETPPAAAQAHSATTEVEVVPVPRSSTPPVAQPVAQSVDVVAEDAAPAVVVKEEPAGKAAKARNAEFALHALSAADLALAQGRLMAPPGASAYTLYKRVLALEPGSREAERGLEAVRQELVNRALAQLAGGALDDARKSLQDAADAGVDQVLVANLRSEVDYRQQRH